MKKVLFMLSSMNIGGVEKSFLSLLSKLSKDEYDITVLLLEKKGGFLEFVPDWVKIEEATWYKEVKPIIMQAPQQTVKDYLKQKKLHLVPSFVATYLISKYLDKRYLYYENVMKSVPFYKHIFDIAIAYHGPTDIIDFFIANKVNAKKKISWVHFDVSKHQINEKLYNKLYIKFDHLFIVSKEAKNKLVTKFPKISKKTLVIHNNVPKDVIMEMSKEKIEFDKGYEGYRIVTVGRLSVEKGQDLAVTVLSRLRKEGIEVRWYCIGEGKYRQNLERMIKEQDLEQHFILLGSSANPYPYMAQADIYVQTSRHEGFCITLAEAISLSKPIVSTNFIGAHEQIEEGINGFIVNTNEEEIYRKVKYLIKNEAVRNKFKQSQKVN
ncbi:glycosyltransferase [Bacillus sp. T3]|uniref:glycosyltransferase n=1 Tax=Bacillus sp. T3 TaxID=467262 RepID=UPI002982066F|nr:glycosyltransferase [Bacillus sp. T3]